MSAHGIYRHKNNKKNKRKQSREPLIIFAVMLGPIMTVPQLYSIWAKGSSDVSILAWLAYAIVGCIWLWHGVKHKDKALIATQLIWILIDLGIVVGLLRINAPLM